VKKLILIAIIALGVISCQSRSGKLREIKDAQELSKFRNASKNKLKDHNVVVRFVGTDDQMPKDGQLLVIRVSLEDTVIVAPANLDDCRRVLEENGKG